MSGRGPGKNCSETHSINNLSEKTKYDSRKKIIYTCNLHLNRKLETEIIASVELYDSVSSNSLSLAQSAKIRRLDIHSKA